MIADEVYEYVEAVENVPLLCAFGLKEKFYLLANFGGTVLAGQERKNGQRYQFVTWIRDYERRGVSHSHDYPFRLNTGKARVKQGINPVAGNPVPGHRFIYSFFFRNCYPQFMNCLRSDGMLSL